MLQNNIFTVESDDAFRKRAVNLLSFRRVVKKPRSSLFISTSVVSTAASVEGMLRTDICCFFFQVQVPQVAQWFLR